MNNHGQSSAEFMLVLFGIVMLVMLFKSCVGYHKDENGKESFHVPAEKRAVQDCVNRGDCRREGGHTYL